MTASRSVSLGRAPRSTRAESWPLTSLMVAPTRSRRKARRRCSSSRPVMPKSSRAVRVGKAPPVSAGSTNRFPAWRSPWKMPDRVAPSRKAIIPARTRAAVSTPGPAHALDVVEGQAGEALHDQHPRGDQVGVGPGHDVGALLQLGQRLGHVEHVVGLEAEVELLGDRLGEQLDQRRRVGQGGHGDAADEAGREPGHDLQVGVDPLGHRGALHLDHHPLPGAEHGAVDLGDGGGGDGVGVERSEDGVEGTAEVLLHGGDDVLGRLGRDPVPAQLELGHQRLGEQALPGGDDLEQLDVGGAQPFRRPSQPAGPGRPPTRARTRAAGRSAGSASAGPPARG